MDPVKQLSHLVWELRFLSMAAQAAHWRVFGPSSYGDHLLYERVYEKLNDLLDPLAERLTAEAGFDDAKYVSPLDQARHVFIRTQDLLPELEESLLDADLTAAFFYTHLFRLARRLRALAADLKTGGILTFGLEDLLASTAADIETLVYFLERRSQKLV